MDPRHFLLSSDYGMPVLVWEYEDYWNVGSYNQRTVAVAHKLPFRPLLVGQWAISNTFNPSMDISMETYMPSFNPIDGNVINAHVGADSTNLILDLYNGTDSSKQLWFRLWAYAPPDYTGEVPNLYDKTNFMLSTDFNYPKIVKAGAVNLAYKGSTTILHGLGYIPQCKVWQMKNGVIGPVYALFDYDQTGNKGGPSLTTTALTIRNLDLDSDDSSKTYYYHIYGDEA